MRQEQAGALCVLYGAYVYKSVSRCVIALDHDRHMGGGGARTPRRLCGAQCGSPDAAARRPGVPSIHQLAGLGQILRLLVPWFLQLKYRTDTNVWRPVNTLKAFIKRFLT